MSAGTGITHSEFNPSQTEQTHLYQIWLLPEREGIEPSYEQKQFPEEERSSEHAVETLMIRTPSGTFVPLREIADVERRVDDDLAGVGAAGHSLLPAETGNI